MVLFIVSRHRETLRCVAEFLMRQQRIASIMISEDAKRRLPPAQIIDAL